MHNDQKKQKPTFLGLLSRAKAAIKGQVSKVKPEHIKTAAKAAVGIVAPYAVKEVRHAVKGLLPKHK